MTDASVEVAGRPVRSVNSEGSDTAASPVTETMLNSASVRTMHIGELAERTGLSLRTIRHYDDVNILPATARTEGGFRVYTEIDLERLMVIRRMKPLGFTLDQMKALLAILDALQDVQDPGSAGELRSRLAVFRASAEERRASMVKTLARADEFIEVLNRY